MIYLMYNFDISEEIICHEIIRRPYYQCEEERLSAEGNLLDGNKWHKFHL